MVDGTGRFRDHDFVETREGFLFCVVGNVHPPGRAIGYLKYVPSEAGRWGRAERYERVLKDYTMPSVEETVEMLRRGYPRYIFRSKVLGMEMSAVPAGFVKRHYKPEVRLRELHDPSGSLDPLEAKVVKFTSLLAETGGLSLDCLGVTGSILTGIHNPSFSDIDLTVYGRGNALKLKTALDRLFQDGLASPFAGQFLESWAKDKSRRVSLSPAEIIALYERKRDRGFYDGTQFSIHPVKARGEVRERYGEKRFRSVGLALIEARCTDAKDSIFLPATYVVRDAVVQEGPQLSDLTEVTSYDGFYAGVVREGETLLAKGKLEQVESPRTGQHNHRLLVGSFEARGADFIKPTAD
ncbi:MAG: hypothetical protein QW057_08650 [Candidatus Bathyarchaeia archaeon]